jgi:D-glycero-D-manno-heptose 1,7-bisphosphate phosphatase
VKNGVAVFLDRDGTIIVDKNYLGNPDGVELLGGARQAVSNLKASGCQLFLFTNQRGISMGIITEDDVLRCNDRMIDLLGCGEATFDGVCIATEGPDDVQNYRKPSPKFIDEMIEKHRLDRKNCYMVGDRESDVLAGVNAGINTVLISKNTDATEIIHGQSKNFKNVEIFPSILEFSCWLASKRASEDGKIK